MIETILIFVCAGLLAFGLARIIKDLAFPDIEVDGSDEEYPGVQ